MVLVCWDPNSGVRREPVQLQEPTLDLGKAGKSWMVILKLMMLLQNKTSGEELMTRVAECRTLL